MNRKVSLLITLIALLSNSCKPKKIQRLPFEIDRSVSASDLVYDGYRWMPGVDVILIGKRTQDTLDYYQIDFPSEELEKEDEDLEMKTEEFEEEEIEFSNQEYEYEEIEEEELIDPLDMLDTMYTRIWWKNDPCYKEHFKHGTPMNRYFYITFHKEELEMFIKSIDSDKYKKQNLEKVDDNYNDEFIVINKQTTDTFWCTVEPIEGGKFKFLSFCSLDY